MRKVVLSLMLGLSLSTGLAGCAALMGGKEGPKIYDQATGPQTIAFDNKLYQTRGEPMPLKDDQVIKVGMAEGFELYQLKGGGGGMTSATVDQVYIKTADGRYQALVRLP